MSVEDASASRPVVGINGMGRTGRQVLRALLDRCPGLRVGLINDLGDVTTTALLMQYDSTYGRYPRPITVDDGDLVIAAERIRVAQEPRPDSVPWQEQGVELVIEATGAFNDSSSASLHLSDSGTRKVVVCAPCRGADSTIVLGVNTADAKHVTGRIVSAGSCTTCAAAPLLKWLSDTFGVESASVLAVHSLTNSQRLLDKAKEDPRLSRSAIGNIVPVGSGSSGLITFLIPELSGRGIVRSVRTPTTSVSMLDIMADLSGSTSGGAMNESLRHISESVEWRDVIGFTDLPLVSGDFQLRSESVIVSGVDTIVEGNRCRLLGWYDHEYGFACRVADLARLLLAS